MNAVEIRFHIDPDKRQEFLQLAASLSAAARSDDCIMRAGFEDPGHSGQFLWVERWTDEGSLRNHLKSVRHRTLMGAIDVLGVLDDISLADVRSAPRHPRVGGE